MKYKLYSISIALLFLCSLNASAQIIFTIAGTDTAGYDGDGLLAVNATFNWPVAVAPDNSGNIYIADMDNNIIRKVNAAGYVSQFAGNTLIGYIGDGTNAAVGRLNNPTDVALDIFGNVYIADQFNHVIRKVFHGNDSMTTYAGYQAPSTPYNPGIGGYSGDGGLAIAAQFYLPTGIAIDASNYLYVTDMGNSTIRKITPEGYIFTIAGSNMDTGYSGDNGAATAAKLNSPQGIAVDAAGNIYFADNLNNVIRKISTSGIISTVAGNGFHSNSGDHTGGYTGDGGPATNAELSLPTDVAIDAAGNLYIADQYNHAIRKVNTSGIISTVAGNGHAGYSGDWTLAVWAELNFPRGVAVTPTGDLLIADMDNDVIRKVNVAHVGVNQTTAARDNIQLILNPNKGIFQVKGTVAQSTEQVTLEVLNMQGQVVYSDALTAQNGAVDKQIVLSNDLPNGVYMLRVNSGTETNVSRFVLEK